MMMSPQSNTRAAKPTGKNGIQTSSIARRTLSSAARPQPKEPTAIIKCPRCDSPNTKFCYYNNYSFTQPRYFCKTCRRYWTKGGALRNVPIGGGCRKNKKIIKPSSGDYSKDNSGSSSHNDVGGGLKFFQGLSPAMDFQLSYGINTPRPNTGFFNQLSSFGDLSANSGGILENPNCFNILDPNSGFNFPINSRKEDGGNPLLGFQEMRGSMNNHVNYSNDLASSIESLSFINQDLHWKLQQQRLAMVFAGDNNNNNNQKQKNITVPFSAATIEPLIQNLKNSNTDQSCALIGTSSRKDGANGDLPTEWFFDNNNNSYATPETSSNNNRNWSGFQAWTQLTQYASLP